MKRRTKGEGTIRKRSDGRWEGRYIDSSGETRYIYSHKKQDIREQLTQISFIKDGNIFDKIGGDVPLKVWFEHYLDVKQFQVKKRSLNQIKMAFYKHVEPVIGDKIMFKINTNDIIRVLNSLKQKGLSSVSIKNVITHMRAMFNFAM